MNRLSHARRWTRSLSLAIAVLGPSVRARADILPAVSIPIVNPSFELTSRPLLIGEQTNGAGGSGVLVATRYPFGGGGVSWANPVEVPGWRTRIRPFGDTAVAYAGVLHPPLLTGQPFITGQDGQNVLALQVMQVGQALNTKLQPNTRYTLKFLGGIGRFGSDYHLAVSLTAVQDLQVLPIEGQPGVTRLAITQGLHPPVESFGTLREYSLEYTSPTVLPPGLINKHIGIHMYGSDGIPRVVFDNFRLTATQLPEPTPKTKLATAESLLLTLGSASALALFARR